MSELTLNGLSAALTALRTLAVEFADLPAATVHVTEIYPERLSLSVYDDFGAFEMWRAALCVSPDDVVFGTQNDGETLRLTAEVAYGGATVRLTGYSQAARHLAPQDPAGATGLVRAAGES